MSLLYKIKDLYKVVALAVIFKGRLLHQRQFC